MKMSKRIVLKKNTICNLPNTVFENTDDCLDYFSNINLEPDNTFMDRYNSEIPFYYHVYWFGNLNNKHLLCVNSYLATQNLNKTKLIVWLDCENGYNFKNISLIPKHSNIIINNYNPNHLSKGTPFENKKFINIIDPSIIKYRSDLARIMILYKYGGLYFDLDLLLFKDLTCFVHLEFCYQWSNIQNRGNNALLCLHRGSNTCIDLFKKYCYYIETECKPFGLDFNRVIFNEPDKLLHLPCALFDPVWILLDTNSTSKFSKLRNFDDFFNTTDEKIINTKDFFNNKIYAYHWHSRVNKNIEKNSYFDQLNNIFKINVTNYNTKN